MEAVALVSKDGKVIPPVPLPHYRDPQNATALLANITTSNHITTKQPLFGFISHEAVCKPWRAEQSMQQVRSNHTALDTHSSQ